MDIAYHEHKTEKKCPVAAVMGFTSNPARYTVNNVSNVLSDDDKEDELNSNVHTCTAIIESIDEAAVTPPKVDKSLAPLTVPHMFWQVSYSPVDNLPLTFDCLLDVSSHDHL